MPCYLSFWQGAYYTVHEPATFIEEECRRAVDAVLSRDEVILIDVYHGNLNLTCVLHGQFVQNRCEPLAVSTPRREEFEQYRPGEGQDLFIEGAIRNKDRPVREKAGKEKG